MGWMLRTLLIPALAMVFSLGLLACAENSMVGSSPMTTVSATTGSMTEAPPMPTDSSAGPAFRMVSGKIRNVDGNYYDVEEHTGNVVRLHVGGDTVKLNGNKKPGDIIRAEITRGGHANSIQ